METEAESAKRAPIEMPTDLAENLRWRGLIKPGEDVQVALNRALDQRHRFSSALNRCVLGAAQTERWDDVEFTVTAAAEARGVLEAEGEYDWLGHPLDGIDDDFGAEG